MRFVFFVESWKPVYGFEGIYEVSNTGRVRSVDRVDPAGHSRKGKELAQARTSGDKRKVTLYKDRKAHQKQVHWLVLEAFVGPRPEGAMGLHWDDDPANNHIDNLRWGTRSENSLDSVRNGIHPKSDTTHCPRGHELTEWNNRTGEKSRGHRCCLACSRAYGRLYSSGIKKPYEQSGFQQLADQIYAELKEEQCTL